jgi:tetratricopeptide (TPR) repeat protein
MHVTVRALACALVFTAAGVASDSHAARAQAADTARVALPDPVLAPDLPRAMAVLDSARAAAAADRHEESIRLYRRAIKLYPPLADELGVELGNQYTWADKPDSAMACYRAYLEHHPGDADAQIGIARLTSWKDDLGGAEAMYDEVLAADSTNLEARLGKAQVINWSGRHREAALLYRRILADHPDNAEARAGLVQALRWMGRPDLAVAAADSSTSPSVDALEREIEGERAPGVSYTYEQNHDSDDIHRRYNTLRAGFSPDLLTRASAEYIRAHFDQPDHPDVTRDAIALVLARRFSQALALNASVGYQWNSFDRFGPESFWLDEFNLVTLDAYATLTPHDWTRIDLGVARGSIDNPEALYRGIVQTQASAGIDRYLRWNLIWISSLGRDWYSDGNSSWNLGTRLQWQPLWRMPVKYNHRFTSSTGFAYFGFSETTDHGYYDPRQYLSFYEEVALAMTFSPRVRARVAGRISIDKENGDEWFPAGRFELSASWSVWRGLGLTAGYTNSTSRLDSRPGYDIDGFYVTVGYLFW